MKWNSTKEVIQQRKHFFHVLFRLALFEILVSTHCKNCNWRWPKDPLCSETDPYAWTATLDDGFAKKFVTFPGCIFLLLCSAFLAKTEFIRRVLPYAARGDGILSLFSS